MPRLTFDQYRQNHLFLRNEWMNEYGFLISRTSTHQQRDLFDFFAPRKELSNDELKNHRKVVTTDRPSLPQGAGRAMAALRREQDALIQEWQDDQDHHKRKASDATGALPALPDPECTSRSTDDPSRHKM